MQATHTAPAPARDGLLAFFALACALTWSLAAPLAHSWWHHATPPPYAVSLAGLSAFGPLLAALAVAGPRGQLRAVFGPWRVNPGWIALALVAPLTLHLLAAASFVALGGHPARWRHPPSSPEQLAALVVFPLGEEFGWRGFAQARMARRFGAVKGALLLGAGWGCWHLMYSITPATGRFDALQFGVGMLELPLYSLLIAWVLERAKGSLAVALAFHAGAHLDHFESDPRTTLPLHALHLLVLAVVALFAARSLARSERRGAPSSGLSTDR